MTISQIINEPDIAATQPAPMEQEQTETTESKNFALFSPFAHVESPQPFFSSRARVVQLIDEAQSWLGTPFVHHSGRKGHGVDCVHLAQALYAACGLPVDIVFPEYHMDGGSHLDQSQLEAVLDAIPCLRRVDLTSDLLPGDALTFRCGRTRHHIGLKLLGPDFIHARLNFGTQISSVRQAPWAERLSSAFRPLVLAAS